MTHIKICGNTEADGVRLAVSLGVDLLGFIFTRSPRRVTIEQAQALIAGVPEHIGRVGVFIDEPVEEIASTVEACELSAVQLYRSPTAADRQLPVPLLPVVRLRTAEDAAELQFDPTDRPLLDTYLPDIIGGTGRTWDWTLAETLAQRYPVIISGGLRPENVGAVIRQLRPWGVDVASGVELSPGVKDLARLEWFVRTVRQSDSAAAQRAAG
jgi:phosphoribosylanthranilate isomerase